MSNEKSAYSELSTKHKAFVDALFDNNMNATRAYREVYAPQNDNSCRSHGSRLVAKGSIQKAIKERLKSKLMTVEEALGRLADQARGRIANYINEYGTVDIKRLRKDGMGHLLDGIDIITTPEGRTIYRAKFSNPQSANDKILKAHGAYNHKQRIEHSGNLTIQYVNDWRNGDEEE